MMDNLPKRVGEHKERMYGNASAVRYTFDRLVYYEPAARDPRCVIPSVSEGPGVRAARRSPTPIPRSRSG